MSDDASLWDLSLRSALERTASESPTPGGGSVAPLSAAFGLGLVLMALEISAKKQPSSEASELIARGRQLLSELSGFVDRDVDVFRSYMRALKLPKQTEPEKAARDAARDAACQLAARTPLQAAEVCLQALTFSHDAVPYVQKNVWSDLLAGVDMLFGALKAVLRTVDINLPQLRDEPLRISLAERAAIVEQEAAQTYARITAAEGGYLYA